MSVGCHDDEEVEEEEDVAETVDDDPTVTESFVESPREFFASEENDLNIDSYKN